MSAEKNKTLSVFDNRELSWLKFNKRVLEESADKSVPLMERLLFESIYCSNLDEFYMVRVGSLIDQMMINDKRRDGKTALRPSQQLQKIYRKTRELGEIKDEIFAENEAAMAREGVKRLTCSELTPEQRSFADRHFLYEIKPLLSACIVDKRHPFPFIEGKEIFAAVNLDSENGSLLGIITCSGKPQRVIFLPAGAGKTEYILAEELIEERAGELFEAYSVREKVTLRLTRSADINTDKLSDREIDYRECMTAQIGLRKKLAPVRMQLSHGVSEYFLDTLMEQLELKRDQIFTERSPLDMSYVSQVSDKIAERRELFYDELSPRRSPAVKDGVPMREQIAAKDILLAFPYETIEPFIRLLNESADDPRVTSIKITLYRVAKNSQIIKALCRAAENGKKVIACVELRAKFDEEHNIACSKLLEEAGCRVMYGPPGLKVHSKLCLITADENGNTTHTTQIGTGNYNEKTAAIYTDLSLMTADPDIAADAKKVFHALSTGTLPNDTARLMVSPLCLQNRVLEMMDNEIAIAQTGGEGYIGAKMNSLTDKKIINKLIECSQAGVKVDLIIRGTSCLVAGVPRVSNNIRIISIVGRYLEHARIYIFGKDVRRKVYISSADFMTRNTCRRIEVAAPLLDEDAKERAVSIFETQLADNVKAREQQPNGEYMYIKTDLPRMDAQRFLYSQAYSAEPKQDEKAEQTKTEPKKKRSIFARIADFFRRKKRG